MSSNRFDPHILSTFDEAIERLHSMVLTMASLCRQSFENSATGLLRRDRTACAEVIADEEEINHLEKTIDRIGIEIITRFQPVASDLRSVISNMKLANNLERVGDQSVNIARRARRLIEENELKEVQEIEPLFDHATKMLRDAIVSYNEMDSAMAVSVIRSDKELDERHKELTRELTDRLHNCDDTERVIGFVDLLFVVRAIERVGDHTKNISEEAIFITEAVDVRHGGPMPDEA